MKKIITTLIMLSMLMVGCSSGNEENQTSDKTVGNENNVTLDETSSEDIKKIISTAPSNTEILIGLGASDLLIAVDNYSPTEELDEDVEVIEFADFDIEKIIEMSPDIIFSAETNYRGSENPFQLLEDMGVEVVKVPTSTSISHIGETMIIIGDAIGKTNEAKVMAEELYTEIESIRAIGKNIENRKNVYIEIGDYDGVLYTSGKNTFLDDTLEIIGANNIFQDSDSWMPVSAEVVVEKNPDTIVTNNSYVENIVDIIKNRQGFETIDAIINDQIKLVNVDTTSRGSQNIIVGVKEIAEAVYPEVYNFEE